MHNRPDYQPGTLTEGEKNMITGKGTRTALFFAVAAAALVSCAKSGGDGPVDAIAARGILRAGVKNDVPGFGLQNPETGLYEGLEIEIAKLLAGEIFGDPARVAFTPVTAKTRGPLLENGDIDLVIATFTVTEERKLSFNFSAVYYTDGIGLLVKKASGIRSFAGAAGRTIGVAQSATTRASLAAAAEQRGISVTFNEFATYPEIKAALDSGRVQVFSVDKAILRGYLDDTTELLPDTFSPQPYGVATRFSSGELAAWVDGKIQGWLDDGTIDRLIIRFGL
jgi:putative glutamine transport system substrate-binding protein